MNIDNTSSRLRPFLAGLAIVCLSQFASAQPLPTDAKPTCTVTPAQFAAWFQTGKVSLNGVVNPANSVTFPNTPNCSFYQWSMQMFMWLTSPTPSEYGGGDGRILNSSTFYDVTPPDKNGNRTFIPHVNGKFREFSIRAAKVGPHGLPVIIDKAGKMLEVVPPKIAPSGKQLILDSAGKEVEISHVTIANGKPAFSDAAGKAIPGPKAIIAPGLNQLLTVQHFVIDSLNVFVSPSGGVVDVEPNQSTFGVLEAQNGSPVYYVTIVNDVYAYFLTGAKNGGITPAPTQFPTTQAELNKITAFAAAHGKKSFPDPDALAIEIKSSWVEAAGLSNLSSYITMTATIPTYDQSNPKLWKPNGQKTVEMALVGIHVVGSTAGHPEMIWATFEHIGNSPNATYNYTSKTGAKTVPQSTAGTWLFCKSKSAGPFNAVHMDFGSAPNIQADSPFTISASDTLRTMAFGGAADVSPNPLDSSTADSNAEIISINNSVRGMMPSGDVRMNYFLLGATWTEGGAAPAGSFNSSSGGNVVGTSKLNNSTMETYTQGTGNLWAGGALNCLDCHVTNTTTVSHDYPQIQALFK